MTAPAAAYLEVSPLFEGQWTGIPAVTGGLAHQAIQDSDIHWRFLYENVLLEREVVCEILQRRNGSSYLSYLEKRLFGKHVLSAEAAATGVCLFPNVKAMRRMFRREALILHDFSALLTPEFHNQDTIDHHANRIEGDIYSSDFFFCVSRATMGDLLHYFRVPEKCARVLPVGISFDPCTLTACLRERVAETSEPYVCVLGTIEPRKNGQVVLELVRRYPRILSKYRIVFVGRDGWNDEKHKLMGQLESIGADVSRIVFSGFVSEATKIRLIVGSQFCIYPSFFEGFGIPVAEAAALGKFVVCSNSSSLVEVAPEMSFYFEPSDVESLADAFKRAEDAHALTRLNKMRFPDIWERVLARGWSQAYSLIREWVRSES